MAGRDRSERRRASLDAEALPPDPLQMWAIDKRIGNVKNEGCELVIPVFD